MEERYVLSAEALQLRIIDAQHVEAPLVDKKRRLKIALFRAKNDLPSTKKRQSMSTNIPIPVKKAVELCKGHRDKHKVHLFSQCWGCLRFSKEEPSKMCFHNPPENRGCKFISKLFDEADLT